MTWECGSCGGRVEDGHQHVTRAGNVQCNVCLETMVRHGNRIKSWLREMTRLATSGERTAAVELMLQGP